jgi:hypothetical protein
MAKIVRPVFYKWQQNHHELSLGPFLRHVNKLTVSYYPFSPKINAITYADSSPEINCRPLLHSISLFLDILASSYILLFFRHFTNMISSAKQPREKKYEFNVVLLDHGGHATVDLEYRNGDKVKLARFPLPYYCWYRRCSLSLVLHAKIEQGLF